MRFVSFGPLLMATMATALHAEDPPRPPEIAVYLSLEHTCGSIEELTPDIARDRGRLIFDQSEIAAVDWMKQVFRLKVSTTHRVRGADTSGAGFWLFVDGEPIYRGVHMPAHSSISCDQVHLGRQLYTDNLIEIETGSPRGTMEPPDPRRDPRLFHALQRLGLIEEPAAGADAPDRRIPAGKEWDEAIDEHLESARIILLLVSADFVASDYIWSHELRRAMERHQAGEARVLPIILRAVDLQSAPFGKLQVLPKNAPRGFSSREDLPHVVAQKAHGSEDEQSRLRAAKSPSSEA